MMTPLVYPRSAELKGAIVVPYLETRKTEANP
jgi:hypothetical protein